MNEILKKIICFLLIIAYLVLGNSLTTYSQIQETNCIKTTVTPLKQNPLLIPSALGETNNDPAFEAILPFSDLDIPYTNNSNLLSTCTYKNNVARLVNFNPENGELHLTSTIAVTDPVQATNLAAIRGTCILNSKGDQIFFNGIGPNEAGFDRIYSYNIDTASTITNKSFFIPTDLVTTLSVTPNGKYLVYLQANTKNNNLASLQSVEIKKDKTLKNTSTGQAVANIVQAGNYIELAKSSSSLNSRFAFGILSNLEDSFAIFKTDQENGINIILGEFKKGNSEFPLPDLFNTEGFKKFSGFRLIQKQDEVFLLISYSETNSTKLALFKIIIRSDLTKKAELIQVGKPVTTTFKIYPCNEDTFHEVSGPIWVSGNFVYLIDNNPTKNENYFVTYFINWNLVENANEKTEILNQSSIPVRTSFTQDERNTDIVVTENNKFAYIVTTSKNEPYNTKIFGYNLNYSNISCNQLIENLKNAICKDSVISYSPPSSTQETSGEIKPDSASPTPSITPSPTPGLPLVIPPPIIPPPQNISGRPPLAGTQAGRPPLIGTQAGRPPSTVKPPLPPPPPPQLEIKPKEFPIKKPKPPEGSKDITVPQIPAIEFIPEIELPPEPVLSSQIDISSLDLTGSEQVIIPPKVSNIVFSQAPQDTSTIKPDSVVVGPTPAPQATVSHPSCLMGKPICASGFTFACPQDETPCCVLTQVGCSIKLLGTIVACDPSRGSCTSTSSDKKAKKTQGKEHSALINETVKRVDLLSEIVNSTKETRGCIKGSTGAYLINLKQGVKINLKDIKNLIYIAIDKENNFTIIPSTSFIYGKGRLLTKLSIPPEIKGGVVKLVTLLNKNNKKEVISKGHITIYDTYDFKNINAFGEEFETGEINVNNIESRVTSSSKKSGKIVKLTFKGKNFAGRLIKINDQLFIAEKFKTHTTLTFANEKDINVLRSRVLENGNRLVVTIRFKGNDISTTPLTISTPKGHFFIKNLGIKLTQRKDDKNIKLELDNK